MLRVAVQPKAIGLLSVWGALDQIPPQQRVVVFVFGSLTVFSYLLVLGWLARRRFDPTRVPEERLGGGTKSQFRVGLLVYIAMALTYSILFLLSAKLDFGAAHDKSYSIKTIETVQTKAVETAPVPQAERPPASEAQKPE
jgi:hypothetical protein